VAVPLLAPNDDGLPQDDEFPQLETIEEQVEQRGSRAFIVTCRPRAYA
jgi:hypothetical protein